MTLSLHFAQFADHLVGRGVITTFTTSGGTALSGGKFYFEGKGVAFTSASEAAIGICGAGFDLTNPISFDVSPPPGVAGAEAAFLTFKTSGAHPIGWGYPTGPPDTATSVVSTNDWIGIAVDTINSLLWWRNATASPTVWWGNGSGAPDPVTGADGFSFDPSTGSAPITGNVYILGGGGNENTTPYPTLTLNTGASGFASAAPTGFSAWGSATTFNPSDKATEISLSGGNLTLTTTDIAGSNQPTAFVRSTTYKTRT